VEKASSTGGISRLCTYSTSLASWFFMILHRLVFSIGTCQLIVAMTVNEYHNLRIHDKAITGSLVTTAVDAEAETIGPMNTDYEGDHIDFYET
jgi:hypothetical protein